MKIGLTVYGDLDHESGGFRYDRQLRAGLEQAGDEVTVIQLPWRSYPRGLLDNLRPTLHEELAVDVDVMLQDELAHPSLLLTNRRLSYPCVSIVHHLRASEPSRLAPLYRRVEAAYLQSIDGAICTSSATETTIKGLTTRSLPTLVAPPAGDRFDPQVSPEAITERAQADPLRLVFLGNLIPRKGVDTLIEALAAADSHWQLTVIGAPEDKPYAARLYRQVDRHDLQSDVTFTGHLEDAAVAKHLRDSHLFAMPSKYEGFGIAYLEAMSFGLPVIASTAGGATDIVRDGKTGFLIDPSDTHRITTVIDRLADDRDELARLGRTARTRYENHTDWSDTIHDIRTFLHQVINTQNASNVDG